MLFHYASSPLTFRKSGHCVILNYHSVHDGTGNLFAAQLERLASLARPVRSTEPQPLKSGFAYYGLTVDDVFESFIQNGLPELLSRKIPVTLFPPTSYLGRQSDWDDLGGPNRVGERVASAAELKQLAACENISFGSHTVAHRDLTRLTEKELLHELTASKQTLEDLTGRPVIALSFPYGRFGSREVQLARQCGYKFCFTSTPQSFYGEYKEGVIGRVDVQPENSPLEFKLKVLGAYRWILWASNLKRDLKQRLNGVRHEERN